MDGADRRGASLPGAHPSTSEESSTPDSWTPDSSTPDPSPTRRSPQQWISLIARLVLAGVWLWASISKLPNLESSVLAVRGYQILPYPVAVLVGYLLPLVELLLGLLLLTGLFTRVAGAVSSLLMLAFIIGISQAWARGLSIDCGCFGGGGQIALEEAVAKYPWEIARDVGLFLLGAWLVWRPRAPFSLDTLLFAPPTTYPELVEDFDEDPDELATENPEEESPR